MMPQQRERFGERRIGDVPQHEDRPEAVGMPIDEGPGDGSVPADHYLRALFLQQAAKQFRVFRRTVYDQNFKHPAPALLDK
jgi:hypothetical protein